MQVKIKVTSVIDAQERYGVITDGVWKDEGKWLVVAEMPDWFSQQVTNTFTKQPCKKIYLNRDMQEPLLEALENLRYQELHQELKTFDGCFSIRSVRGMSNSPSAHSYGLAIDFNASENALGQEPNLTREFAECFIQAGFSWGGHFKRLDGMHFSYAWE